MEQFVVSARKYRPVTFDSVVGQKAITTTLQNAIRNNHLAQAFLFCGPRGVGKTTCARILAREINISESDPDQTDFSFNIFELDAASNNSVDDIRGLIDQVRIPPQTGQYKVYIIDEVHMLSAAAFNAFLKTLEEPPAHAIFILATTEKHKILPTILSRCQIFDFQRIRVEDMAEHLLQIAGKEGVTAEPDALHLIAQKADGGLRDALSIFDQVVSFCGNDLTYQAVISNLNILDYDYYFRVTQHFLEGNIPAAMLIFDEILSHGFDGHLFINGLSSHLRNLLVSSDPATLSLLEAGQNIRERYREQAAATPMPFLTTALAMLNKVDVQYKSSKQPRLLVEIALMQLCNLNQDLAEKKNDSEAIIGPARPVSSNPAPAPAVSTPAPKPLPQPTPAAEIKPIPAQAVKQTQPIESITAEAPLAYQTAPEVKAHATMAPTRRRMSIAALTGKIPADGGQEETSTTFVRAQHEDKPFSEEDLRHAWKNYVDKVRKEGKALLATTLSMRPFQFTDKNILLELENAMQEEQLKNEQADLMEYIRHTLGNFSITMETTVVESTTVSRPYTNREKFLYLAEKHPALNKLRQQFDLDID